MLADEFYLIAHEEQTGRSRIHPRATGLGLAAGLLGELILLYRVRLMGGEICVVDRAPPGEELADQVLSLMVAQPQHRDLRTWLAFLSQEATDWVGDRLARAGVVERMERRRLLSTRKVYLPMDWRQRNRVVWASARLANVLTGVHSIGVPDQLLAGLVSATGLTKHVLWDVEVHRPALENLGTIVSSLPADLHELVEHTEASIGSVLVAGRR